MTRHDIWYAKPYVNIDGDVRSPGEMFLICNDCKYNNNCCVMQQFKEYGNIITFDVCMDKININD